jgi:hypothetical protein
MARITTSAPPIGSWPQGHSLNPDDFAGMLGACDIGFPASPFGLVWYVDGNRGRDTGNDGLSAATPFLTMAKAFASIASGDTIYFRGNIREQLSTPAGVFDVTIIGGGNRPRHADAHTGNGGYSAATWKQPESPTASTPLLKVKQQGWRTINVLFSGAPAGTPAIQLFRDGGAGDLERDASHFHMLNCRVDGAPIGIQDSGGCAFVRIENTLFRGMTTTAINAVAGAGIGTLLCWQVLDNMFQDNVNHMILGLNQGIVRGNLLGKFTTKSIDLTGGTGYNVVTGNTLSGTYSEVGGYIRAAATDEWGGNLNSLAGGVTASDPA